MALELAERYRFCVANHRTVLLDLQDGTYSCLSGDINSAFRHLAAGGKGADDVIKTLQPLVDDDILEINAGGRGLPSQLINRRATQSLFDQIEHDLSLVPDLPRLAGRLVSEWTADTLPFHRSLDQLRRKRPVAPRGLDDREIQVALRRHLATRRWVTTQDRCLPWSISLVHWLRSKGLDARLVIGVQTAPWCAHAWAECDDLVLNDSLDRVLPYVPILEV